MGIDIVAVKRIENLYKKFGRRFLERAFTSEEIAKCLGEKNPAPCLAGKFAAKEALIKAIGVGFRKGVSLKDITVTGNATSGPPFYILQGKTRKLVGTRRLHLSISHESEFAIAVCIIEP